MKKDKGRVGRPSINSIVMNFDIHQKVSSVLALLFIALLSTLLGIVTIGKSDDVVSGFSDTVVTHAATLKK